MPKPIHPIRVAAAGSVALTGLGLVIGALLSYLDAGAGGVSLALVVLGALPGIALVGAGVVLYRSDVTDRHTVRVAGWNLLGVVVLGSVLLVARIAPGPRLPGYVVVDVLGVSSVAHVLIGYKDVRRIQAEDLAHRREKLAVVNRLVRHNIRNETQILTGYAAQLVEELDDPVYRQIAENIGQTSAELSMLHDRLEEFQRAVDDAEPTERVPLRAVVTDVVGTYSDQYPDGTFETDVPDDLAVAADDQLRTALDHLVENAIEHGSEAEVYVRVTAEEHRGLVTLTVSDRGPGLPEAELAVLAGQREQSQLEHASGLGLWVVRAVVERYGGDVAVENGPRGANVTLSLEAA